jgi:putative endonuclease
MPVGWVYIMTNRPNGTLCVGVTSDVGRRLSQHLEETAGSFTNKYRLYRLAYIEQRENIVSALQREKNIKHWPRAWEVRLIGRDNPRWDDLAETLPY